MIGLKYVTSRLCSKHALLLSYSFILLRACPSEFVIPLARYRKSIYGTQLSVGMRFGMMFETEESGKRRYVNEK